MPTATPVPPTTPTLSPGLLAVAAEALIARYPEMEARIDKAAELALAGRLTDRGHGRFSALASDGKVEYVVNCLAESCACNSYLFMKKEEETGSPRWCKHFLAVMLYLKAAVPLVEAPPVPAPPPGSPVFGAMAPVGADQWMVG